MGASSKFIKLAADVAKKPRAKALRQLEKGVHSRYPLQSHLKKVAKKPRWKPESFAEMVVSERLHKKIHGAGRTVPMEQEGKRLFDPLISKAAGKANPKAQVNLTNQQWKMLMNRVTQREMHTGVPKTASPMQIPEPGNPVDDLFGKEPPETKLFGRLRTPLVDSQGHQIGYKPQDYPYAEAQMRYLQANRAGTPMPKTDEIPPTADVMSGGKYERRVFKPVGDPARRAEKAAADVTKEKSLEARGKEQLKKLKTKMPQQMTQTPSEKLVKTAMLGDRLWKFIGGKRTTTGKLWDRYRQSSRESKADTRDYFIRAFLKWADDADRYMQASPREAKSLSNIWEEFTKQFGDQM